MGNKITELKKEFKVNDTSVWFDFNDQLFISNLFMLMTEFEKKPDFDETATDIDKIRESVQNINKYLYNLKKIFDDLFGEGATERVFKCKLPTLECFAEFIMYAMPLIEECFDAKEENQKRLIAKFGNRQQRRLATRR